MSEQQRFIVVTEEKYREALKAMAQMHMAQAMMKALGTPYPLTALELMQLGDLYHAEHHGHLVATTQSS